MEAIDVYTDMVVVRVMKLGGHYGVQLDAEDMVGCVAVVPVIEEAQVWTWESRREVLGPDEEDDAVAAQVQLRVVGDYLVWMPKMNDVEKDRTAPPGDLCRRSDVGWTAWPLRWTVPLVSSRRPFGVTLAVPSSERGAPVKPE